MSQFAYRPSSILLAGTTSLLLATSVQAIEFDVKDTKVSIYGFAKLNMIYDADADLGNAGNNSAIRLDDQQGSDGHTTIHAYHSRLGFKTATPLQGSALKTRMEIDWFDEGGGDARLRHFYGEWNNILAGKTWTNFGVVGTGPAVINVRPAPGQSKIGRKAQLRYSWNNWHVALETPDPEYYTDEVAVGFNPDNGGYQTSDDYKEGLPDLTLRYQNDWNALSYVVSGMVRQLEVDDGGGNDDSAVGWGLNIGAKYELGERVTLRAELTHGDGIGEYMQGNPSAPAYYDGDKVETIKATGGILSTSVAIGPGEAQLAYSVTDADLDDLKKTALPNVGSANKRYENVYLNYVWTPVKNIDYGLETSYQTREVADGRDGDALRFQGMVRYRF
ncbi:DcaP family trimeric outer membrane transporter [Halomonas sp. M20]|uniref:DcaP family trimeric outer membrane transporter n=1 Tax=Halomonas sp. M20 TaxID=2763264 RepID=UPI001D0B0386|nr:DcaP family trimeric outer membrane transporter [Halomonas sp. M20]